MLEGFKKMTEYFTLKCESYYLRKQVIEFTVVSKLCGGNLGYIKSKELY